MNKTAVRQFAAAARKALNSAVMEQICTCCPAGDGAEDPALSPEEHDLAAQIRAHGMEQTAENAAYDWFIRFAALRFLEVSGYLPSGGRVFTDGSGAFCPARLSVSGLLAQCDALYQMLPECFAPVSGWMRLLFPEQILQEDGILARMVTEIPEEDWRGQVQIIGWLYQYYNAERKDQVFAGLKKNIKISAETLPAATQLFTPDWIARYLTENSLGRLWAEGHGMPEGADWDYYIEEAPQQETVRTALDRLREEYRTIRPEQLRIIDPCMGSGHILISAFEVLMDIYISCGWSAQDAALSIVQHNLYGLDIDRRVYRLAYFAVMMKARQYHPEILELPGIRPQLACFSDASGQALFPYADVFGSLMDAPEPDAADPAVMRISRILSHTYDAVITNPPYMGSSSMDPVLSDFVKQRYPEGKMDLFACFIEKCRQLTSPHGFYALLTMQSWMFLLSFEQLRDSMMENDVVSLVHLGSNAFDQGEVGTIVQAAAFVMRRTDLTAYRGTYLGLNTAGRPDEKIPAFFDPANRYCISKEQFLRIPGHPVAYWASGHILDLFGGQTIGTVAAARQGMTTSDNERFVRRWYEAPFDSICFDARNCEDARRSGKKWFPYNKGGGYRKWYGNHDYVVNFEDGGRELREFHRELNKTRSGGRIKNQEYYFRRAIAWNYIALTPGFRFRPDGFIFDVAGSSLFTEDDRIESVMAYLCSKVAACFLHILNPTMNLQANDIRSLPFIDRDSSEVRAYAQENIALCKADWDAFETSWDFARHPLFPPADGSHSGSIRIADRYALWEQTCEERFCRLKSNEEALNRIFIDIYGLQDELTAEVADRTVTVRRADRSREVRSLISYAVGCLCGRYSPDRDGIVCAGRELPSGCYEIVAPAPDAILPVGEDGCYENDLTDQIIGLFRRVYGSSTLEENLRFIAGLLDGKGTPREVLRGYLRSGFFADHCRIYQKRPVYWMFSSGRQNGFKALVYMHRWSKQTVSAVLTDYLPQAQAYHRARLRTLEEELYSAPPRSLAGIRKQIKKTEAQLAETEAYAERLRQTADGVTSIDPDDGVKVNYQRFSDILEKIRG